MKKLVMSLLIVMVLAYPMSVPSVQAIGSEENREQLMDCLEKADSAIGEGFCVGEYLAEQAKDAIGWIGSLFG